MIIKKYLVVSGSKKSSWGGWSHTTKMVEKLPKLKGNEVSILLNITIPDMIFERPTLEAKINLPEGLTPQTTLTAELASNIENILKTATSLDISVAIVEHPVEQKVQQKTEKKK